MTELVTKWDKLWKDFEAARKSEWLKAKEAGKFNQLIKERVGYKKILESLEVSEVDLLNACGGTRGRKIDEVPFLLKSWVSKMAILKKDDFKKMAKASLDEMDKATKPNTYRALKVLITGIDSIGSLAEYVDKTLHDAAASAGKVVSSQERIAKVEALAVAQVKKGVMKALAEIQKVKSATTPEAWTALISNGGTRDLCMALTSLHAAQQKGGFTTVPAALPHKNATQPFNTAQAMAVLGPNDDTKVVAVRLKAWSGLVKAVATDYQAHW